MAFIIWSLKVLVKKLIQKIDLIVMSIGTGFLAYSLWNDITKISMIPNWMPELMFGIGFFSTFYYLSNLYEQAMESRFHLVRLMAKYKINKRKIMEIIKKEKINIMIPQFQAK